MKHKTRHKPLNYKYAFVCTQNGGEIVNFTIPVFSKKLKDIKAEVKRELAIDTEIVDIY